MTKMGVMSGACVKHNCNMYNCLINGFCKARKMAAVEESWNDMRKMRIKPNIHTYASLTIHTYTTLINRRASDGRIELAFRL